MKILSAAISFVLLVASVHGDNTGGTRAPCCTFNYKTCARGGTGFCNLSRENCLGPLPADSEGSVCQGLAYVALKDSVFTNPNGYAGYRENCEHRPCTHPDLKCQTLYHDDVNAPNFGEPFQGCGLRTPPATPDPTSAPTTAPTTTPTTEPPAEMGMCCSFDYKTCTQGGTGFCNLSRENCLGPLPADSGLQDCQGLAYITLPAEVVANPNGYAGYRENCQNRPCTHPDLTCQTLYHDDENAPNFGEPFQGCGLPTPAPTPDPTTAPTTTPTTEPTMEPPAEMGMCCTFDYKTCPGGGTGFCDLSRENCLGPLPADSGLEDCQGLAYITLPPEVIANPSGYAGYLESCESRPCTHPDLTCQTLVEHDENAANYGEEYQGCGLPTPAPTPDPTTAPTAAPTRASQPEMGMCCSWDLKDCNEPNPWCDANEGNCEQSCRMHWINGDARAESSCVGRMKLCDTATDCCGYEEDKVGCYERPDRGSATERATFCDLKSCCSMDGWSCMFGIPGTDQCSFSSENCGQCGGTWLSRDETPPAPTARPTAFPTAVPTYVPTAAPSAAPSDSPFCCSWNMKTCAGGTGFCDESEATCVERCHRFWVDPTSVGDCTPRMTGCSSHDECCGDALGCFSRGGWSACDLRSCCMASGSTVCMTMQHTETPDLCNSSPGNCASEGCGGTWMDRTID